MTDLEMTKLCAEAMGLCINDAGTVLIGHSFHAIYSPLTDDSQAMALVKRFHLSIDYYKGVTPHLWEVYFEPNKSNFANAECEDLNRAIVECVAKLVTARTLDASPAVESTLTGG